METITIELPTADEKEQLNKIFTLINKTSARRLDAFFLGFITASMSFFLPIFVNAKFGEIFPDPILWLVESFKHSQNLAFIIYLAILTLSTTFLLHFTIFKFLNRRDEKKLRELSESPIAKEAFRKTEIIRSLLEKINIPICEHVPNFLSFETSSKNKRIARYFAHK